jgi:hypothetical protein
MVLENYTHAHTQKHTINKSCNSRIYSSKSLNVWNITEELAAMQGILYIEYILEDTSAM